jgi:nitrogen-specific signal transduction histidine kinase
MAISGKTSSVFPFSKKNRGLSLDIDLLPCAVGLWSKDRRHCVLNSAARKLIQLSDEYLRADPDAWLKHIHAQDRPVFLAAWKRLRDGRKTESCDYRFSPNGDGNFLWVREVSVSQQDAPGEVPWIISSYENKEIIKEGAGNSANVQSIISGLLHNVRNHLQTLRMGLDCLDRLPAQPEDVQRLVVGVEHVLTLLRQLSDYFFPPEAKFLIEDAGMVFEDVVRHMESALQRKKVRLSFEPRNALPPLRIDVLQFRRALERIIELACALLPEGGELKIETGTKEASGRLFIELRIVAFSPGGVSFDGNELFRPFLRVNGYDLGLNMVIADQIIRRHEGKIVFQREDPTRGAFSILLEAISADSELLPTVPLGA